MFKCEWCDISKNNCCLSISLNSISKVAKADVISTTKKH